MGASLAQQEKFIEDIGYIIQEEAMARGYHVASPIIAQACCESAYGTSSLGYKWHNYFGMKCGRYWEGKSVNLATKEEYNSQLVNIRDNFRVFDNMEEGVKGYFIFISTKRYSNLKDALTPSEYLENIKADGYATSSKYVSTNLGIIDLHNLQRFDWENPQEISYPLPARLLRRGDKGEDVKWLQYELSKRNYPVGNIDGIFGPRTEAATKQFQQDHFVDGIVGPLTINAFL